MDRDRRVTEAEISRLEELDRSHWLHPQGDLGGGPALAPQLVFRRGQGSTLFDLRGRPFLDAMAGLWNVNVGYGRAELAEAAAEQMRELPFSSAYGGFGHAPAILLATRLAELTPGDLEVTFFASGGAEANETAYKIARLYWRLRGRPEKVQIVARLRAYHGLTYGATSATGLPMFWEGVGPLAPGFLHAPAPHPYRYEGDGTPGEGYAEALERMIVEAGPETVAAVVAEPVQGAGGVIVPPGDYLGRVREICDRYDLLLIADEVITGFGRTGRWFGVEHFGVVPDLLIFAKGVTSGYLPLSGVVMTRSVHEVLRSLRGVFPHGFTYSGHPVACAVALRNLRILEEEGLVERAQAMGEVLRAHLEGLRRHELVGDVRSLGLLGGIELVRDRDTREPFPAAVGAARQVAEAALEEGVLVRALSGDVIAFSPPLVITEEEIARAVEVVGRGIERVSDRLATVQP
ncbi:MAG TPA: aspartate aminotransferase family protein [Candidatus Dormibacteraeota bacterium]|nr:aspartate aminotransferase family protein [Candidatus Dormibacteraeota bacterium]